MDNYLDQLRVIRKIKFTAREIEILVCIVNNRSDKKIAYILNISYRTVGTHIRNIMSKLRCNSKETIIDFIESSDKLPVIRDYYNYLIFKANFNTNLTKITQLISNKIICNIVFHKLTAKEKFLIDKICTDLQKANIIVNNDVLGSYTLQAVSKETSINSNHSQKAIFLLLSDTEPKDKLNYISFVEQEKYFNSIFLLIKRIVNNPKLDQIITDHTVKKYTQFDDTENIQQSPTKRKYFSTIIIFFGISITLLAISLIINNIRKTDDIKSSIERLYDQSLYTKAEIPEFLPEKRNKLFTGRKEELHRISDILNEDHVVVISAPPGYGKSSLALEYAYLQKLRNINVIWLDADSYNKIRQEYMFKLAIPFGIQNVKEYSSISTLVNYKLKVYQETIVLIFDNVENYEDIQEIVNSLPNNVYILITTRDNNLIPNANNVIKLKAFNQEESYNYLKKAIIRNIEDKHIQALLEKFSSGETYPYQLKAVATYVNDNSLENIEETIEKFNPTTLWNYLFNKIDKKKVEWELLQYSAYLNPDLINMELIKQLFPTKNNDTLKKAVQNLEKLSFVKVSKTNPGIIIHRLTQDSIKKYMQNNPIHSLDSTDILNHLIQILDTMFPKVINYDNNDQFIAEKLYKHLKHVISTIETTNLFNSEHVVSIYDKLGEYNRIVTFNYPDALRFKKKALAIMQEIHDKPHKTIASLLNDIGIINYTLGKVMDAIPYHEKAIDMYKNIYNQENHTKLATAIYDLAESYHLVDQQKGLQFHKAALEMRKKIYKTDHIDLANSINAVGLMYKNLDDPKNSLLYQEQALEMRRRLYKSDHPDIAQSLNGIGLAYDVLGDTQKSLEYLKQALEMRQNLYQDNHPDIAQSLNNVGRAYYDLKDYDNALKYTRQALAIRQIFYNGDHPDVARSLNNIGLIYVAIGNIDKGIECLENALEMRKKIYGSNNAAIAMSLYNIGNAYSNIDDSKKLEYIKQACSIITKVLGNNHQDTKMICKEVMN